MITTLAMTVALSGTVTTNLAEKETGYVAVLPVSSETGLSETRAALVLSTARSQLPAETIVVMPEDAVAQAWAERGASCGATLECRSELGKTLEAQYVVAISVDEPAKQDFRVRTSVVDVAAQTELASYDEMCSICSETDLKRLVREQTLDARLVLQHELNPEDFGEAPRPETVVVEKPGETRVEVRWHERSKLIPAGWGLVGAGAAATVGGAVLLGIAGADAGCPIDPRVGHCVPLVYDTLVPGAIVGSVGVALAATGVGLVVAGRKKDRGARERIEADVAVGPGSLTLRGRF